MVQKSAQVFKGRRGMPWLWATLAVAGVGVIAVTVVLLGPSQAPAAPAVTWSSQSVSEIVFPGSSETIEVPFTASKNIGDVVVEVVPELKPHVSVTPESFSDVGRGDTETLQLTLRPPAADPVLGSFVGKGTVHLRAGTSSRRTFARPLPVELFGLPPDPGEAGKTTLEGIDADGDGIRDDVQRFIAFEHPDSARTRAALTQYAGEVLAALPDASSKKKSIKHARAVNHAQDCLWHILDSNAPDVRKAVRAQILNTNERSRVYFEYDAQLSGSIFPSTPEALESISCQFDPVTLPD